MSYNPKKCEDDQDAARFAESILRALGYVDLQKGSNQFSVDVRIGTATLLSIAVNAERIARWARSEVKRRGPG